MTWETWWALVLGFTLSGGDKLFVSEEQMTHFLGNAGRTLVAGARSVGAGIATIGGAFRMVISAVRAVLVKLYIEGRLR